MLHRSIKRAFILAGVCQYLFVNQGLALIKSADGHDEFFLAGSLATGFDSNITSAAEGKSDVITSATVAVDYIRNAGLIGVTGELSWTRADFAQNAAESFSDPTITLELNKKNRPYHRIARAVRGPAKPGGCGHQSTYGVVEL